MSENKTGKIWWIADNQAERDSWGLEAKGAKIIEARHDPRTGQIHVVFELEKARAVEILGYEPDQEEWLCEENCTCACCTG